MHHVDRGEKENRQQDVHGRTGDGDQEAVPPRMVHELAGIVGALIHRILAAHLDVAAERQQVDAIVGFPSAEADQALAESNGELLYAHPQQLGHGKMAELVDQDHEPQNWDNVEISERTKKLRHSRDTYFPTL